MSRKAASPRARRSPGLEAPTSRVEAERLLQFFEGMLRVRGFEDRVHEAFQRGLVFGTTHLCQGQEATSVGAVAALRESDTLTYTYRGHGQVIARGMDPAAAFAEIFGRDTGCSRGLGGSMHLADLSLGLLGSFAIVGAGLPVAVGAGISAQLDGRGDVAMTFFGDGATNIGAFHEAMNMASVWKLPVIFVCENNLYGEYSPILTTTPFEDLARRADAYAMPAESIDGNQAGVVFEAAQRAVARARRGDGPSFLECKTYRTRGHSRSDPGKYRPPGELDAWLARDPIAQCEAQILAQTNVDAEVLLEIRARVAAELDAALAAAAEAPFPALRPLHVETLAQYEDAHAA